MPSEEWKNFCISVNAGANYSVGDRNVPFEICAQISEAGKEDCYGRILSQMISYAKPGEDIKALCQKISDASWRQRCEAMF